MMLPFQRWSDGTCHAYQVRCKEMSMHTTGMPMLQKGPAVLMITSHCLTRRSRDLGSLISAVRMGTFWIVGQCVCAKSLRSLCSFSSERLAMAHLISSCSRYMFAVRACYADPTGSKQNSEHISSASVIVGHRRGALSNHISLTDP